MAFREERSAFSHALACARSCGAPPSGRIVAGSSLPDAQLLLLQFCLRSVCGCARGASRDALAPVRYTCMRSNGISGEIAAARVLAF
eukprot:14450858-Alexandrium_andersonii.AAC.1